MPDVYVGHGALCDVHCMEGNEFLWNVYTEIDPSDPNNQTDKCGGFPIFYPYEGSPSQVNCGGLD
jgi:hypothetical protein